MDRKKKVTNSGYYADPRSPIASSPIKRQRRSKDEPTNSTYYDWPKRKLANSLDDTVDSSEENLAGWTDRVAAIFSPVFNPVIKYLSVADEQAEKCDKLVDTSMESLDLDVSLFSRPECVEVENEEEVCEEEEFDPYTFMKSLPAYETVADPYRATCLPKKTRHTPPISLVLDLDETLVHCCVDEIENPDMKFPVEFNGEEYLVHVRKRPHMDDFLKAVSKMFEVIIFTASQQVYAEKLLNMIDPDRHFVKYRLYRDSCLPVDGNYLKDLNVLGRDLSKVVLVDNSPHAFGYQVNNGIPIESWFEDSNDTELLKLLPFLESLCNVRDVRPVVEKKFQTQRRIDSAMRL